MSRINIQTMRDNNIRMILNTIRKVGPISRVELARMSNLTAPAVTNICNDLLADGLIEESGYTNSKAGRKPILLRINPSARYLLTMAFTLEEITVAITDFAAEIVVQETHRLNAFLEKDVILSTLIDSARACLEKASIDRKQILAMGIAAPGPIDQRNGVLVNPPNFPDWKNVPICRIMEDALGFPAVLDKETNAAALGEYYLGTREEYKTMFYIMLLSNSIGGSILHHGAVVHGFEDGAGDIGHSLVDINGPRCACGQYGCLERVATGNALVQEAKSRLKSMNNMRLPIPCDADHLTLENVFQLCELGVHPFVELVDYAARMIATAIGNVISILSPSRIVIGGSLVPMYPALLPQIESYIHSRAYPDYAKRVQIVASALGSSACIRGAAMVALDEFQTSLVNEKAV